MNERQICSQCGRYLPITLSELCDCVRLASLDIDVIFYPEKGERYVLFGPFFSKEEASVFAGYIVQKSPSSDARAHARQGVWCRKFWKHQGEVCDKLE